MNRVRFSLTAIYGIIVLVFFLAYVLGFLQNSNFASNIFYVGFLIMLGIVLSMAASASE